MFSPTQPHYFTKMRAELSLFKMYFGAFSRKHFIVLENLYPYALFRIFTPKMFYTFSVFFTEFYLFWYFLAKFKNRKSPYHFLPKDNP